MIASVLVGLVVNATVIVTVALVAARLARSGRAAVRHVLLTAAFAALRILPIASFVGPTVPVWVRT